MNKELKHMLIISISLFFIFVFIFNIYTYHTGNFIPQASRASQIISYNRLRSPNTHRASEKWTYPKIEKKQLALIALKKPHKIFVVDTKNHHVLYIIHAQVNLPAQNHPLRILHARGQQIYHISGSQQATAKYWLGISNGNYIETPLTDMDNHHVPRCLQKIPPIKNTIQVSKPDAKWLQGIPENTPLLIKEDY
ncbi:hypothetical protein H5S09_07155 [Limosilactobacillus sp. STM2_1]|uniref:Uncharacterized protein n=1 Tax=Limosilactobacillus rudii TaxID=2759755 RepID=A0A7W3ULG5_9LACO|nr:hypothetical protein [Limosilactobacillus rudii]MBB1079640.1 hypothetical protein [Limosilactobacillus rudii]MBB1097718.1 hypothetical protein [Limosilactobacillus rudii]MCD7134370.1 hypothetical protein [Limosilactobacillus rudii]